MSDDVDVSKARKASPIYPPYAVQSEIKTETSVFTQDTTSPSHSVKMDLPPDMNTPRLSPPSNQDCLFFVVTSLDSLGRPIEQIVHSYVNADDQEKLKIWKEYNKNLREIAEYGTILYQKQYFQELLQITAQNETTTGVAEIPNTPITSKMPTIQDTSSLEKNDDSVTALRKKGSTSSEVIVVPLTGSLIAGALVVGVASGPSDGIIQVVEQLQPSFPQAVVQDLIPMINLTVMGPIYFNSWNEAIGSSENKLTGERTHIGTIQKFSKDILKIVNHPTYISITLMSQMRGYEALSNDDVFRLASMIRIILLGTALSLMYSAEVGKVQDGTFGGMTSEEFKSLLLGEWNDLSNKTTPKNEHEEITRSLINNMWNQLHPLNTQDRTFIMDLLLDYVSNQKMLYPMLDPTKVISESLQSQTFHVSDAQRDLPQQRG